MERTLPYIRFSLIMLNFSDHEFASPVRRRTIAILIGLIFAGFIFRFGQLQLWEGSELRGAASAQGIKRIERIPIRGVEGQPETLTFTASGLQYAGGPPPSPN